jgi:fructosamine-3-kinase
MSSSTRIDIENFGAFTQYLIDRELVADASSITMMRLDGGVSNRTILIEGGTFRWVAKQALQKLRVKVDWQSDPARINQEALALEWLPRFTPPGSVPRLVFHDGEAHILIMDAVPMPHENWKHMLLRGDLHPGHVVQFGYILGMLHAATGRDAAQMAVVFHESRFFETLRVEPYYEYTCAQHPETRSFYSTLIAETRANRHTLVHGDYSPKNVLVHENRLILLDYEVIHFGDPAFDVGFSMTHLLSKANHRHGLSPSFTEAAGLYWTTYQLQIGSCPWAATVEGRAVRHTLACMLARIDGRSPLEYLDEAARDRQRTFTLRLIAAPPATIQDLLDAVEAGLRI